MKFVVPSEFEVELSVAEEMQSSQFFFVGVEFLFSPTSDIPKGKLLDNLDQKVNAALVHSGLVGCYSFLHGLALTLKIIILFKQASDLSHGLWLDTLRVDLLRRTLVVQYWSHKSGPKSWIELGISKPGESDRNRDLESSNTPSLRLKWIRDGIEEDPNNVHIDLESLCMESILRSVTSLHISHLLLCTYERLRACSLYKQYGLGVAVSASAVEPGNCSLDIELTKAKQLKVMMDHVTGTTILRAIPPLTVHYVSETDSDRSVTDEMFFRICRLRCFTVREEIDSYFRLAGWERIEPQHVKPADVGEFFPASTIRYMLFSRHKLWRPNWTVAFTSAVDGDSWWIVHLRDNQPMEPPYPEPLSLEAIYPIDSNRVDLPHPLNFSSFGKLAKSLSEAVEIQANLVSLAQLSVLQPIPHRLCPRHQPQTIVVRFEQLDITPALQIYPRSTIERRPSIKGTIRLSLHAVDSGSSCATMLARGRLSGHIESLRTFTRETCREMATRCSGTSFGMYFRVPIGQPVVFPLFIQIQQLEIVISSLKRLEAKQFVPQAASLARVDFAYGKFLGFRASIKFKYHQFVDPRNFDDTASLTESPRFRFTMDLYFPPRNPHRRIKEPLVNILNDPRGGLDSTLGLLVVTMPLLHALAPMCLRSQANEKTNLSVQLSTRDARVYRFRYSSICIRLNVYLCRRRGRVVWVLRSGLESGEQQGRSSLQGLLSSRLYNSSGDGWVGLRNGAIAEAEKVGNLLAALDNLVHSNLIASGQDIMNTLTANSDAYQKQDRPTEAFNSDLKTSEVSEELHKDVILID